MGWAVLFQVSTAAMELGTEPLGSVWKVTATIGCAPTYFAVFATITKELARLDAVVFDPPRQGAQMQARELAASPVPILVAVSCNPLTFARDAKILVDGGYRLTRVTPVDQFLYSAHVELVARFEK